MEGTRSGRHLGRAAPVEDKKFACTHAGCTKRFTRAEHLQRHALNHTSGDSTCPRCSAHFKRPDLLDRHMKRHQQKDEEAGGEGCGFLDTRKRAWKASDGSVVERRPHPSERGRSCSTEHSDESFNGSSGTNGTIRVATGDAGDNHGSTVEKTSSYGTCFETTVPASLTQPSARQYPTSPISDRASGDLSFQDYSGSVSQGQGFQQQQQQLQQPQAQLLQQLQQPQPQTQPQPLHPDPANLDPIFSSLLPTADDPWQLLYEQPFQPDTASSFNMPYTTALDYNWLFNVSSPVDFPARPPVQPGFPDPMALQQTAATPAAPAAPFALTPRSNSTVTSMHHNGPGDNQSWSGSMEAAPSHDGTDDQMRFASPELGFADNTLHTQPQPQPQPQTSGSRVPVRRGAYTHGQVQNQQPTYGQQQQQLSFDNFLTRALTDSERPLSMLEPRTQLPSIDRVTHERLLAVISSAKPNLPECSSGHSGASSISALRGHSLLSQTALQSYLDLFFTRFNAAYPIVHLATFDPATAEPLLLLAIVLLGATYAAKDAHQVAVCIHDVIRPCVFAHDGFSARPELWTLQTILLVECFGKSRAGQKQHDMSHLFHGLLINLIRRSDCQSVRPPGPPSSTRPDHYQQQQQHHGHHHGPSEGSIVGLALERAWLKWAEAEQKKRLALYCFMWDTQHAVLFCQSLCMSAFELRLHFPCSQSVWEAPDAASWAAAWWSTTPVPAPTTQNVRNEQPQQPFYLPSLRAYLIPGGPPPPAGLSAQSRLLVLHGLMSICWDMQRRDQTSLGSAVASLPGTSNWRELMATAYGAWKVDFDAYCTAVVQQQPQMSGQRADEFVAEIGTFAAAANAVYHAAQCLLRMDFLDVQIYAGARHILGRPVQQRDYRRSAQVVKRWASAASSEGENEGSSGSRGNSNTTIQAPIGVADAAGAAWHAARMLREVVPEAESEAMAGIFHVPWCLYLATLTCWAFHHAAPLGSRGQSQLLRDGGAEEAVPSVFHDDDDDDADEIVWDARAEMEALVTSMAASPDGPLRTRRLQGRRRTNGLVWVMADVLTKVRWGIVHAGVLVLRGLVPTRLINQYEAEE